MINWMIRATELHLDILYEELHRFLIDSDLIHADEIHFEVIRDGRATSNKSYMWIYCTGGLQKHPIVLYDYRNTRKTNHLQESLWDYSRILVADGYQSSNIPWKRTKVISGALVAGLMLNGNTRNL